MTNNISLAVIVISYNSKTYLEFCLTSIVGQINPVTDRVYLIDNHSMDGSVEMVRQKFPHVDVTVNQQNMGFGYACNQAWRASSGDLILFVNGDTILPPQTCEKIKQKMQQDPGIGILSPELLDERGKIIQMSWGWDISLFGEIFQKLFSPIALTRWPFLRRFVYLLQRKEKDVSLVSGACMVLWRNFMDQLGGFDENFQLYFEDCDLCFRSRKEGRPVRFTPEIKVVHSLGKSAGEQSLNVLLAYRQGQVRYYRKHRPRFELAFLKIYLFFKYLFIGEMWMNRWYRSWIIEILLERKVFFLRDY